MSTDINKIWEEKSPQQLAEVLVSLANERDMKSFLRDVMTEKEIIEISARLEAARLLTDGEKYLEVTRKTKLSSRTVARISDWLKNGCNGYQVALQTINTHHSHISPVSAE